MDDNELRRETDEALRLWIAAKDKSLQHKIAEISVKAEFHDKIITEIENMPVSKTEIDDTVQKLKDLAEELDNG